MMNIFKKIRKISGAEKGSLMVESLVGLSLITIGMLGILSLVSNSVKANHGVGVRFMAANLAAEGVEVVKNIVDTDVVKDNAFNASVPSGTYIASYDSESLTSVNSNCGSDCRLYFNESSGYYNHDDSNSSTIFKRKISIDYKASESPPRIVVNSRVQWIEAGKTNELNIEDHFYNWRQ